MRGGVIPTYRRLLALAVGWEEPDAGALAALRQGAGSWRQVERLLERERLAPLLAFRAQKSALPGDDVFQEYLRATAVRTLAVNLKLRKQFEEVRGVLARAGIIALPLKGVDLAFTVYPSPACRPMADVDILVPPEHYGAAQEVLRSEGFVPVRREPRWWPARLFRRGEELVDLHWSPAAALPPRRGMATLCYVGCDDAKSSREEFRLLVSVCHHQNHFFALPLLCLWETAWLTRRVSWSGYVGLARRWGIVRATEFVLSLAASFFGIRGAARPFPILRAVTAPAAAGGPNIRGMRAAVAYALSLDNPVSAFAAAFRRPAWARAVVTRRAGASD